MTALQCYNESQSKEFLRQVEYYMVKAAIAIIGEDSQTAGHTERVAYAKTILAGDADISTFAVGVSTNSTIATKIAAEQDYSGDLEFTVTSMFNDYAGYDG